MCQFLCYLAPVHVWNSVINMQSRTVAWPDIISSVRVQGIADPAKVAIYGGSYGGA